MHGTTQSNSENIDWETPKTGNFGFESWGLKELVKWYNLTLDVCADDKQQSCCAKFYTKEETYIKPWDENFFANFPWKTEILEKLILRAISEARKHHVIGVCLLPSYTGTPWFQDLVIDGGAEVKFINGRVKYWRYREPYPGSPNIDSIITIYHYAEVK